MNIIKLKFGDWSAEVDSERGACCISLKNKKYRASILRELPDTAKADNPVLYGMPILFPVNRIEDGKFTFEGREYIFPINDTATGCHLHGTLHSTEFEVVKQSESSVICRYAATSDKPYLSFPHEFKIELEYGLSDVGLTQRVRVTNLSDKNMPYFLGSHTSFNCLVTEDSKPENVRVGVDISEEYERDTRRYLPTGSTPPLDLIGQKLQTGDLNPFLHNVSKHYRAGGAQKMFIRDIENKLCVTYETDEKYAYRLIFGSAEGGFICLEPQTCLVNCQNSDLPKEKSGFLYLVPNETAEFFSRIMLSEDI